jgi:hypothetical protein
LSVRTVILHYHLFKNAGTSFDGILRRNFPSSWVSREFDNPNNAERVSAWIESEPSATAFSSHTANGPVPAIPGVRVISCLFLRDPIARIRSAYQFERRQILARGDAASPEQRARHASLEAYVRARLAVRGDCQCRDFHCARLASVVPGPEPELERAKAGLERLSFVGRVEDFQRSMAQFCALATPVWPGFDAPAMHLNRSDHDESDVMDAALSELLEGSNLADRALIRHAERTLWAV